MNTGLGKSAEEKFLIFRRAFRISLFKDAEWNLTRMGRGLTDRLFLSVRPMRWHLTMSVSFMLIWRTSFTYDFVLIWTDSFGDSAQSLNKIKEFARFSWSWASYRVSKETTRVWRSLISFFSNAFRWSPWSNNSFETQTNKQLVSKQLVYEDRWSPSLAMRFVMLFNCRYKSGIGIHFNKAIKIRHPLIHQNLIP